MIFRFPDFPSRSVNIDLSWNQKSEQQMTCFECNLESTDQMSLKNQ